MESSSDPEMEVSQLDVDQAPSPKEAFADFSLYLLLNIPAHFNTPGLYLFILQCW